jgi:DNA polymerase-3 subunit delta
MPKIDYIELKNDIKLNNLKNIYCFYGEEKYLIKFYTQKILEKTLNGNKNSFNFINFDGEEINLSLLADALETFPVGNDKKCIIVKNLNLELISKSDFYTFLKIISDIPNFTVLIIQDFLEIRKGENQKILMEQIAKFGIVTEFSAKNLPVEKQAIIWAKEFGKTLSLQNAELLSKICSKNLNTIKNSINKLCFLENNNEISEENIKNLDNIYNKEYSVFDINKAFFSRNYSKVFEIIENLLNKKEEPVMLTVVIASDFIDAYRVKCAQCSGVSLKELSEIFNYKGKEFKLKNVEKNFKNYNIKQLEECIKLLTETDFLLKTARIPAIFLIDELIVKICMSSPDNFQT